ncbi:hypothetical protein BKA81DRAFT_349050 [Phyllosticta paracitricarpa]
MSSDLRKPYFCVPQLLQLSLDIIKKAGLVSRAGNQRSQPRQESEACGIYVMNLMKSVAYSDLPDSCLPVSFILNQYKLVSLRAKARFPSISFTTHSSSTQAYSTLLLQPCESSNSFWQPSASHYQGLLQSPWTSQCPPRPQLDRLPFPLKGRGLPNH